MEFTYSSAERGLEHFWLKYERIADGMKDRVKRALSNSAELILERSKTYYLTGGALHVQTGRLRSSVTKDPRTGAFEAGRRIWVEIGTFVRYGHLWEFGGILPEVDIYPKNKRALHFVIGGKDIIVKHVHLPARLVKPRPWLWPAVIDRRPMILKLLIQAGVEGAGE